MLLLTSGSHTRVVPVAIAMGTVWSISMPRACAALGGLSSAYSVPHTAGPFIYARFWLVSVRGLDYRCADAKPFCPAFIFRSHLLKLQERSGSLDMDLHVPPPNASATRSKGRSHLEIGSESDVTHAHCPCRRDCVDTAVVATSTQDTARNETIRRAAARVLRSVCRVAHRHPQDR